MFQIMNLFNRSATSVNRRQILSLGTLGFCSLNLSNLLRAEEVSASANSRKSVIFVHLDGGPPQHETIDPKPEAPAEIRGPFSGIATSVPGIQIGELLPKMAANADKFVFVRSLVGSAGRHDAFQCQSGFSFKDLKSLGGRPALGCVVTKLKGSPSDQTPPFIDMMQGRALVRNSARSGFLGPAYQPFRPDISSMFERNLENGMKGELKRLGPDHVVSLNLNEQLSASRIDQRLALLSGLDHVRREIDQYGMMDAMDRFNRQAVSILTSGKLADALDFNQEAPEVLKQYHLPEVKQGTQFVTSESAGSTMKFLMARRLVEAGVRVVSLSISEFDTHTNHFKRVQNLLPIVDHGMTALVNDLEQRGMLDDVVIVAWGEFGRTPRVNSKGGRDHWPKVGPAIMAGGGLKTGQVIGQTNRLGAEVIDRPVTYKDVMATVYHCLQIDPYGITLEDPQGRPQYLLDAGTSIRELV